MSERARAIRQAVNRFAFHRDQHHGWRRAAGWLLLCNALTLAALGGALALYAPVYVTVAATPDGRLVPLTPLDEPIMSDAALRNWTVAAVTEAFTLGHHDWRLRLSSVRESFTDEGYESFLASLNESLFLDRLRDNLQVASAVAQGAPVVTDTRYFEGRLGWAIEFPLLVTFAAGARSVSQDLVARVLVMRVPLSERPAGIGIEQLLAEKRRPSL
ncbi:MAG: DotI/IcmL/TraM family protein [Alphaproteobacteria bacterium]|nr:DotI/IcmL/TraM family protein [Alphaproteobacteria bacterium]